jgi:hypothetical protein
MDFHATVIEVLAIAGVGAYIGFLIGLKSGVFLSARKKAEKRKTAAPHPKKARAKSPSAS